MVRYHVQSKTENTTWTTEETVLDRAKAQELVAALSKREARNDDGELLEYRVLESV